VSFSGGKDSTVLLDLARRIYPDIEAVFIDTGLEYPEIKQFVKTKENVTIIKPEMRFDEVIKRYGYPLLSKDNAQKIYELRTTHSDKVKNIRLNGYPNGSGKLPKKWQYLVDSDFLISHKCCSVMKKRPSKLYEKETNKHPIIGTMTYESTNRKTKWLKDGCNAFETKRPISAPMSFWTEQDIFKYLYEFGVDYCPVYGSIIITDRQTDRQLYSCTGCDRTGCIFCGFGCHLEKEPNRFQRLQKTHPRQYDYCIGGGKYVDGIWQPNKNGLGLSHVLDEIGVNYR
jgi:3'-phosphoadenosine 5'-phosphosulfate sulfotransferase (PAPS reductase)/FAD synthetase